MKLAREESSCVIGKVDQNLMSIVKNVALLMFAALFRFLAYVVFSVKIWEMRNAGHSDLQGNNCVRVHFHSFSICLCNTDISGCTGRVAAALQSPLAEIHIRNLFRFHFLEVCQGYIVATNLLTNSTVAFFIWFNSADH